MVALCDDIAMNNRNSFLIVYCKWTAGLKPHSSIVQQINRVNYVCVEWIWLTTLIAFVN